MNVAIAVPPVRKRWMDWKQSSLVGSSLCSALGRIGLDDNYFDKDLAMSLDKNERGRAESLRDVSRSRILLGLLTIWSGCYGKCREVGAVMVQILARFDWRVVGMLFHNYGIAIDCLLAHVVQVLIEGCRKQMPVKVWATRLVISPWRPSMASWTNRDTSRFTRASTRPTALSTLPNFSSTSPNGPEVSRLFYPQLGSSFHRLGFLRDRQPRLVLREDCRKRSDHFNCIWGSSHLPPTYFIFVSRTINSPSCRSFSFLLPCSFPPPAHVKIKAYHI